MSVQRSGPFQQPRFIANHNFHNGTRLCLVQQSPSSDVSLLFWDGSTASIAASFELEGQLYKPLSISSNLLRNVRLPPSPASYGSLEDLVAQMAGAFQERAHVPEEQARLLAYCSVASWFPEAWGIAPCVCVISANGSDGVLVLNLLSCFCRHAVVLAQASAESLLHICPELQPTLLLNYSEMPQKVQGIINASCYRGLAIPRASGEMVHQFGFKAVATLEPPLSLENSLSIEIPPRQGGPATFWDEDLLRELASEFQPKLLRYRLERFREVVASNFDVPEFTSPMREIARSLGMCLCSTGLREDLSALLCEQDEEIRAGRSAADSAIIIEAMLMTTHDLQASSVYMGKVAEIGNAILEMRGEQPALSARGVGAILKAIGLYTQRLDKAGRGLPLDRRNRAKIHALARNYGVRSIANAFPGCPHCKA